MTGPLPPRVRSRPPFRAAAFRRAALAALACIATGASGLASTFPPNQLFLTDPAGDRVLSLAPSCALDQQYTAAGTLVDPKDLAFGPNGLLYLAFDQRVVALAPTGVVVKTIGAGSGVSGITAMAFGPEGHLFLASSTQDRVVEMDLDGVVIRSIGVGSGLDEPRGVCFGPNGRLYVSSFATDRVFEFAVSGEVVRKFGGTSPLDGPGRVAFGPANRLYVVSTLTHRILGFDESELAIEIGADAALGSDLRIAFGPDGRMFVGDASNGSLLAFDTDFAFETAWPAVSSQLTGLAFAPHRFKVSLSGTLAEDGDAIANPKENAVLAIHPGSRILMLDLDDLPLAPKDLATVTGARSIVLHGFEVREQSGTKFRNVQSDQLPAQIGERGIASLALRIKGHLDAGGRYVVDSATGTLNRSAGGYVYSGTLKTLSPVE